MMYYYNNALYPSHMCGSGSIFMILFWLVVIYLLVMVFKNYKHHTGKGNHHDILKERYAKGEITKEQFESMKKDLS